MKGVYALIILFPRQIVIEIGVLGKVSFDAGMWIYVGSARGSGSTSLENRLKRHFRSEKKIHWHIDRILNNQTKLVEAIWSETDTPRECRVNKALLKTGFFQAGPKGFGSSDCTSGCKSHIMYYIADGSPIDEIKKTFRSLGLEPMEFWHIQ
jgi:Uri superfamily endonuclease